MRLVREQEIGQADMVNAIANNETCDWLLYFEALELGRIYGTGEQTLNSLELRLQQQKGNAATLIDGGLQRLGIKA